MLGVLKAVIFGLTAIVDNARSVDSIDMQNSFSHVWYFFYLTLYVFSNIFIYYPYRCPGNHLPSKISPLGLPMARLKGYMNSETRRLSWKIKVSFTTRLQYDIINGDKHTRAWKHKNPSFLGEFQEIKCLQITEISIADESETK